MRRLIILLLFAVPCFAEVLTNADVVKLVQAGLSAETIVAKIETTATRFDVSTDALVALAKDGVPDRVIHAMITAGPPAAAPPPPAAPAQARRIPARRYDVAVHRDEYARCEGELRVDGLGVRSSRCRGVEFVLTWPAIQRVCYDYGFRGTIIFVTGSGEHRISTTTPAEAKRIVEHVRAMVPVAQCAND